MEAHVPLGLLTTSAARLTWLPVAASEAAQWPRRTGRGFPTACGARHRRRTPPRNVAKSRASTRTSAGANARKCSSAAAVSSRDHVRYSTRWPLRPSTAFHSTVVFPDPGRPVHQAHRAFLPYELQLVRCPGAADQVAVLDLVLRERQVVVKNAGVETPAVVLVPDRAHEDAPVAGERDVASGCASLHRPPQVVLHAAAAAERRAPPAAVRRVPAALHHGLRPCAARCCSTMPNRWRSGVIPPRPSGTSGWTHRPCGSLPKASSLFAQGSRFNAGRRAGRGLDNENGDDADAHGSGLPSACAICRQWFRDSTSAGFPHHLHGQAEHPPRGSGDLSSVTSRTRDNCSIVCVCAFIRCARCGSDSAAGGRERTSATATSPAGHRSPAGATRISVWTDIRQSPRGLRDRGALARSAGGPAPSATASWMAENR